MAAFTGAMAPGSYLIISVGFDGSPAPDGDFADTYNAQAGPAIYRQSREGINALFSGLEVDSSRRRRSCARGALSSRTPRGRGASRRSWPVLGARSEATAA